MGIQLTEKAASEVKRIIADKNLPESTGLRIGVKGGGCSGFSYTLGLDSEKRTDDEITESRGIPVFCDAKSIIYLKDTQIDFKDELMGRGFVFSNPNAKGTCGCGESFSA